ncbi:MAG: hypothetical protein F6K10_14050 [Moorea sp. SIO2B7]|nr:hypothetical protein [Moorena sp. SIO2B7]
MSVSLKKESTGQFVDIFAYLTWGVAGLVILAMLASTFMLKNLVSTTVNIETEDSEEIKNIALKPGLLGALRIDVRAIIRTNHWVTYEIQVLDAQGNIIGSAIKQAWKESGTWYEDGESGTWSEKDLMAGLDIKAKKEESITIAIKVLEYGNISGQELDLPVSFRVEVLNGVIDSRYLQAGLFATIVLAIIAVYAVPTTGNKVIRKKIADSDPSERAIVGGADNLVRVKVKTRGDKTCPYSLAIKLIINNQYGEQVYQKIFHTQVSYKTHDGKIYAATAVVEKFFVIKPRTSYNFKAEVLPDAPIDWTILTVREHSKTRVPTEVIYLTCSN